MVHSDDSEFDRCAGCGSALGTGNMITLESLRAIPALLRPEEVAFILGRPFEEGEALVDSGEVSSFELGGERLVRTAQLAEEIFGVDPRYLFR